MELSRGMLSMCFSVLASQISMELSMGIRGKFEWATYNFPSTMTPLSRWIILSCFDAFQLATAIHEISGLVFLLVLLLTRDYDEVGGLIPRRRQD
jgi:hypothetical protein